MIQDIKLILTSKYPSLVKDAVRYGYLYRKESEVLSSSMHFCLPEASAVLLWIASAVLYGVAYDVIKENAKKLFSCLKDNKKIIDEETEKVLKDDEALKEFTVYIEEYYTHDMKISVEQEKYIKEEVAADASGEESRKIFEETGRIVLTTEEFIHIRKKAYKRADELIHRHK